MLNRQTNKNRKKKRRIQSMYIGRVDGMLLLKSKQKQIQSGALYKYIVDLWLYDILYNQKIGPVIELQLLLSVVVFDKLCVWLCGVCVFVEHACAGKLPLLHNSFFTLTVIHLPVGGPSITTIFGA